MIKTQTMVMVCVFIDCLIRLFDWDLDRVWSSINQLINQSINQSINQLINQLIFILTRNDNYIIILQRPS